MATIWLDQENIVQGPPQPMKKKLGLQNDSAVKSSNKKCVLGNLNNREHYKQTTTPFRGGDLVKRNISPTSTKSLDEAQNLENQRSAIKHGKPELTVNCIVPLVNNEDIDALDYMDSQAIYCNDNCKKRITEIWSDYTILDNTFLDNIINDKPELEEDINTQIFLEDDYFGNMEQFEMPSDTNYQKDNDYIEEVKLPDLMNLDFF